MDDTHTMLALHLPIGLFWNSLGPALKLVLYHQVWICWGSFAIRLISQTSGPSPYENTVTSRTDTCFRAAQLPQEEASG
jgi:hypothetical protein